MKIVIATKNKHKYDELKDILYDSNINFLFAGDFPDLPDIEENGSSLFENALIKAKSIGDILKKPCIADDTGFFVRSLNWEPGINAAHYAGKHCSYEDNISKVLNSLCGNEDKFAYFQTITVLYNPLTSSIKQSEGTIYGNIIENTCDNFFENNSTIKDKVKQNSNNQLIISETTFNQRTFAEMTDVEKNRLSHRYKSAYGLKEHIKSLCLNEAH
jgi:XTP/dITP diphosphohydrolase